MRTTRGTQGILSHHRLDTFEMLLSICNFCRHSNLSTLKGKLRLVIRHRVTHQSKTCRLRQVHALSPQPTSSLCGLFRNPEAVSCRTWENSSREPCIPQRLPRICWTHGLHHLGVCPIGAAWKQAPGIEKQAHPR